MHFNKFTNHYFLADLFSASSNKKNFWNTDPMRAPCTGSYSQAVSVHEHGWSEPAKTIPGEVEEPVDGERT